MPEMVMYCDGLCEPVNPGGWACWAWVLLENTRQIQQACGCLGHGPGMTNNLAEYQAVIRGLRFLQEHFLDGVCVRTDSQLVVRQLQGIYAVRSPAILPLYQEALPLVRAVQPLLEWVPREQNELADALTREAYAVARGQPALARTQDLALLEALQRLDSMSRAVSEWEATFLDSMLRQVKAGRPVSQKQRAVVQRMCAEYLSAEAAAEVAGQQRLAF